MAAHTHDTEKPKPVWGMLAEFESPAAVYHAAEKVRDAGYRKWDVYSPIPVHGMDEAMGLKPSKMAWIVGICAAIGATAPPRMPPPLKAIEMAV